MRLIQWRKTKPWGMLLLGIWLIVTGVLPLIAVQIPGRDLILSALAIAAGVLILLER